MRKFIDTRCLKCETVSVDHYIDLEVDAPMKDGGFRCECGGRVERAKLSNIASANVHSDGIPGGLMIKNGVCNPDGTPKRYDYKSDIRKAAKAAGLTWGTTYHTPDKGSDKSKHTSRWV